MTHYERYRISRKTQERIEEVFGWMKMVGLYARSAHRGLKHVGRVFTFTAATYNLVRKRNLVVRTPQPQCA